VSFFL
jgi:hypothetical protein